jgi:hypothetical protein
VEITDAAGETVRSFEAPVQLGVNRIVWDLRRDAFKEPPRPEMPRFFEPRGPEVLPGTYTVTVRYGDAEASTDVEVLADPRIEVPRQDREAKLAALLRAGALQEALTAAIERIHDTQKDVETVLAKARKADEAAQEAEEGEGPEGGTPDAAAGEAAAGEGENAGPHHDLLKAGRKLARGLRELETSLWEPPDVKGIPQDTTPWQSVSYIQRSLGSSYDAPTPSQQAYLAVAETKTTEALEAFNRFFAEEVTAFRDRVRTSDLELLPEQEPVEVGTEPPE